MPAAEKKPTLMASSTLTLKPFLKDESPLMLRDYLRDDFSSCSSNGFKSFPRRQCCPTTTVRLLLEFDLQKPKPKPSKRSNPNPKPKPPLFHHHNARRRSATTATATVSAFHRASEAVLRAVKSLPFHSSSSSVVVSAKKSLRLPRSLSRRLLRRSFFRRKAADASNNNADNVGGRESAVRWRSFREFLEEQEFHAPPPTETGTGKDLRDGAAATSAAAVRRISTSSDSNSRSTDSNKCNNSWSGSEFTADSGGSEIYSGSNDDSGKNDLPSSVSEGPAATAGDGESSTTTAVSAAEIAKQQGWPIEEKEQFSPVSVLDCPFDDDEDDDDGEEEVEVNSPFCAEGACKKKVMMKKTRRFDCLAQLQPLDLQKRITTAMIIDDSSSDNESSSSSSSTPDLPPPETGYSAQPCTSGEQVVAAKETMMVTAKAPHELLSIVKERRSSNDGGGTLIISKAELLLLDYFEEKSITSAAALPAAAAGLNRRGYEEDQLKAAEEWVKGEQKEMFVGWEVKESRYVYLKQMEEEINGGWRNVNGEEGKIKEEVVLEVEDEIFTWLINELVLELC